MSFGHVRTIGRVEFVSADYDIGAAVTVHVPQSDDVHEALEHHAIVVCVIDLCPKARAGQPAVAFGRDFHLEHDVAAGLGNVTSDHLLAGHSFCCRLKIIGGYEAGGFVMGTDEARHQDSETHSYESRQHRTLADHVFGTGGLD